MNLLITVSSLSKGIETKKYFVCEQEYIIKEKRVSNFAIANVECMRKVT